MTGNILINGVETGSFMSKVSGYVYQEDLFVGSLTVSEHLHFMVNLVHFFSDSWRPVCFLSDPNNIRKMI